MQGTLQFITRDLPKEYTADEISLAQAIADHLAPILDNVTLHERTESERAMLDSIVASMGEGLLVADKNNIVLYCNHAAGALLGLRCEDYIGLPVEAFQQDLALRVGNTDAFQSRWRDAASMLNERTKVNFDMTSGPNRLSIEATLFSVGRESNRVGTGVLLRDVTREREIDHMKTEFISIASHELRTPLTSLYGFAELLLTRPTGLSEEQKRWVEMIHKEGKRLTDIIGDLLNISRIESGRLTFNLTPVALRPLVAEIVDQIGMVTSSHSFEIEMPDRLPAVQADQDKLRQVMHNLLDNAVKYSPNGGLVRVCAVVGESGKEIQVSVSDQGLGIPQGEIAKLFTRFYRVQRPEVEGLRGTGLGLYIVKSLAEMMRGRVWVESTMNKGSTFHVSLPIMPA